MIFSQGLKYGQFWNFEIFPSSPQEFNLFKNLKRSFACQGAADKDNNPLARTDFEKSYACEEGQGKFKISKMAIFW